MKLIIPDEQNISKIPSSLGQIPFVSKLTSVSAADMTSSQRPISNSFFTSNLAAGFDDKKEVNQK